MENIELTKSVLKLMRAMRRRPMHPGHEVPPAVGRMLMALRGNEGISPAELCEMMDVRPSSMSELLSRMEAHGLIRRENSEEDKRATKVFLSEAGTATVEKMEARFHEENAKLASCFNEEELETFVTLCNRFSAHVEEMAAENPGKCFKGPHCGPHHDGPGCGPHHGGPGCGPHHGGPHGFHRFVR